MAQKCPKWPKNDPKRHKMTTNGPKMTTNGPKMTCTFPQYFLIEKAVPKTFFAFRMYDSSTLIHWILALIPGCHAPKVAEVLGARYNHEHDR